MNPAQFAADLARTVEELRTYADAAFGDSFTAYAFTTTKVDDLDVQAWVSQGVTPGKVAGPSAAAADTQTRTVSVGGVERPVVEGGLHIPISAPLPAIGWEYVCDSVGPQSDPALVGRRWRVVDVPAKSYATARRLDVVEVPNG